MSRKGARQSQCSFFPGEEEQWWNRRLKNIAGRFYRLGPLDIPSALSLGTHDFRKAGVDRSNPRDRGSDTLYRLVTLLTRNPLAFELVLPHAHNKKNLSEFYEEIHSGSLSYRDVCKYKPLTPAVDHFLVDIDKFFMNASNRTRNISGPLPAGKSQYSLLHGGPV